ncbi:MAG TPA: DUF188 domain-containing protein, partial [Candidatus Goldiibacteriota bacterium]|nr:DUF188 domain-containing protein [Candidatus Goldiibacteriota bacterium]
MRVIIDGDSQPEKNEIIVLLQKHKVKVVMVMSVAHYSPDINSYADVIYVDNKPQETDVKIMNIACENDIVITADTGLSFFLAGKKTIVIDPRGKIFNSKFAGAKIETLHIEKKLRRSERRVKIKGPKPYLKTDLKN